MMTAEILKRAFNTTDSRVVEEIIKDTRFKYLGTSSVDLHINTTKTFVVTKLRANIFAIKEAIYELEEKTVRDVYINGEKIELKINELNSKHDIGLIDLVSLDIDKTNEMSGENNIVDQLFEYESSVLQKTKVQLYMYQKTMNREWKEEVSMSVIKNKLSLKRRTLVKRLQELINLKYEPNNNDTKEIIELLRLK